MDLRISHGPTQHILIKVLGMKHVNVRLVPKNLTFLQKQQQVEVAKKMFDNVAENPIFIKSIVGL